MSQYSFYHQLTYFKMKQFNIFLLLFLCSIAVSNAQISDQVIGDTKFWATGKLKPVTMFTDERDPKVAVKLQEEFGTSGWYITEADSSKLDNACVRMSSAKYNGGLNQPLKLNLVDSFTYTNNRLGLGKSTVYNTTTNPATVSSQTTTSYTYNTGSTRTEPDLIITATLQGTTNTQVGRRATFDASNRVLSITYSNKIGTVFVNDVRNTYSYGILGGLTNIVAEQWLTASSKWVSCLTCENVKIAYDNAGRLIEQVKNASNGDSLKTIVGYIGSTSRVKTITNQLKTAGTTTWIQVDQATNTAQNALGYPTNIDYFDGSDSLRIGFQYLADSAMTQRLITAKSGTSFTNASRITQTYCTPCTAVAPVIQAQPNGTTTAYIGGTKQDIGIFGLNITSFQWQVSENGGALWKNITLADSSTYTFAGFGAAMGGGTFMIIKSPILAQNGYQFRVIVYNGCSAGVVSTVSVLSVQNCTLSPPTISSQPQSLTRLVGQSAAFSVVATNVSNYEWFYYLPTDSITRTYVSTNDTTFSGQNTNTLTLKYAKTSFDGYKFYCNMFNGCTLPITSTVVKLTVQTCTASVPTVQTQALNTTVNTNATAMFTIATNTVGVNYRWEQKTPAATVWSAIFISDTIFTGQQTNTLTINYAKYAYNAYKYRCRVFTCAGQIFSDSAALTVLCPGGLPTVVSDPSTVTTRVGTPVQIEVTGTNIVSAQWQVSNGNGGVMRDILPTDTTYTISPPTATKASITVKYPKRDQNGFAYRVILSNSCGNTKASDGTGLIVNFPLAVNELDAKVRVYPNPTNSIINIDLPVTNFKITLTDSKGSVVLRVDNKTQISVKDLPTGLYFMHIKTDDGETTKKIVKN